MPKGNLLFKERDVRRAIRGVTKAGVAVDRVLIDREGNIAVIARAGELPSPPITGNDWDELLNGDHQAQAR
jgi:hypothetical protein